MLLYLLITFFHASFSNFLYFLTWPFLGNRNFYLSYVVVVVVVVFLVVIVVGGAVVVLTRLIQASY